MVDMPWQISSVQNPLLSSEQQIEYQSKIGSCLCIVISTRPECLFAINLLYKSNSIYIASTPDHGLVFSSREGVVLYMVL